MTAHAEADTRERALAAGFQLYMAKPVDPAALTALVAALATDSDDAASAFSAWRRATTTG